MKNFLLLLTFLVSITAYCQTTKIDDFIKTKMTERNIPGLQLAIVKKEQIILSKSYGIANIEDDIKVDDSTTFAINSMTKAFTGVAIMQLQEQGKLDIEDPIQDYLDNLPESWRNITIKQCLTHTSGLPNMMNDYAEILATWEEVQQLPIVFEPNTDFEYNQTNYTILGKIINKLSGMSFQKFIQEHQLKPVNANRTIEAGFGHYEAVIPHSARGYSNFKTGNLTHAYEYFPEDMRTAAGMSSTALDLANWHIALQNGELISKQSLKQLWTPAILNNGKTKAFGGNLNGYAIGTPIMLMDSGEKIVATIGGGRVAALTFPDKETTIIILTNLQGAFPERFIEELLQFID